MLPAGVMFTGPAVIEFSTAHDASCRRECARAEVDEWLNIRLEVS